MVTPIPDFPGFVDHMLGRGYSRNPCRDSCPDHGDAAHVHLRTPDGDDMIAWADGRVSDYDLTQPARLVYPVRSQRQRRFGARVYRDGAWS
jgi:hypothetical protein